MATGSAKVWRISPSKRWTLDRPRVLAIANMTPDSFSDGGDLLSADDAARRACEAMDAGADGIDIGGESTRPGASRIAIDEQARRVVPAIVAMRKRIGESAVITIDSTLSAVAAAALDAGADAINDVSAGREDDAMFGLAASRGCGVILMHRLAPPGDDVYSHLYAAAPDYSADGGVVPAVRRFLSARAAAAQRAGVAAESIVLDPGLGFGKTVEQNLLLIEQTPALASLGFGVQSGLSRKSFVARAAGMDMRLPPAERASASVGLSVLHLVRGASIFRVHDVSAHVAALRAAAAALAGTDEPR